MLGIQGEGLKGLGFRVYGCTSQTPKVMSFDTPNMGANGIYYYHSDYCHECGYLGGLVGV